MSFFIVVWMMELLVDEEDSDLLRVEAVLGEGSTKSRFRRIC